jgi:hypothetical protein
LERGEGENYRQYCYLSSIPAKSIIQTAKLQKNFLELDAEGEEEEEEEEVEEALPIMMPGLPGAGSMQLAAWLHGQLSADQLRNDLVDTLTNCRAVVACTMHKTSQNTDFSHMLSDDVVK